MTRFVFAIALSACASPHFAVKEPVPVPRPARLSVPPGPAGTLLLRHARLFDGTGAPVREDVDLRIVARRIAEIGPDLPQQPDQPVLDLHGSTVLPGLIDAHVHLSVVPGAPLRGDDPETQRALRRQQLRAYLACGVTTVLDTAMPIADALEIRRWIASGEPGPRFLTLGAAFLAEGGYGTSLVPEGVVHDPAEIDALFDRLEGLGVAGVKTAIESGRWPVTLPVLPDSLLQHLSATARARRLPLYVHALSEPDYVRALALHPYALAHLPTDAPTEVLTRLREGRVYVISTLQLPDALLTPRRPQRLEDPLLKLVVPAAEQQTLHDAAQLARSEDAIGEHMIRRPVWLPAFAVRAQFDEAHLTDWSERMQRTVRALHQSGVPLVVGSDSGNWPWFPSYLHGIGTIREMELLGDAGLPPAEVIVAATSRAAQMLGLETQLGTVEVGKLADLAIYSGDPLADLHELRSVELVLHDGEPRTPEGWISTATQRRE